MIEIAEIIVQSLLKTIRWQYKMVAAFTLDFVGKVSIIVTIENAQMTEIVYINLIN